MLGQYLLLFIPFPSAVYESSLQFFVITDDAAVNIFAYVFFQEILSGEISSQG